MKNLTVVMSMSNEEEREFLSGLVTWFERAYIKIKTLRGRSVPQIVKSLLEVCGEETLHHSTVQR